MAASLGKLNPFRYRGYVFDEETGLYYLRSRYYHSEWTHFLITDLWAGKIGEVLSHNLFIYCSNNPITYTDHTGLKKTYVFYYYFPESATPLHLEAFNSPYYFAFDSKNVEMIAVKTSADFISAWNSMGDDVGDVYLYLHGSPGKLQFAEDTIGLSEDADYSFDSLNDVRIQGYVYDFACYGAAKNSEGKSIAAEFARKTLTWVYACDVGVSYHYSFPMNIDKGENWRARTQTKYANGQHWHALLYSPFEETLYDALLPFSTFQKCKINIIGRKVRRKE